MVTLPISRFEFRNPIQRINRNHSIPQSLIPEKDLENELLVELFNLLRFVMIDSKEAASKYMHSLVVRIDITVES